MGAVSDACRVQDSGIRYCSRCFRCRDRCIRSVMYTMSTAPWWVQAGAVVRIILMLIWLVVIISDLMENR